MVRYYPDRAFSARNHCVRNDPFRPWSLERRSKPNIKRFSGCRHAACPGKGTRVR